MIDESSRITFAICTESGWLEKQSILLVSTLREFGGRLAGSRVLSFAPRPGRSISTETRLTFERLGVEHVDEALNTRHADLPYANKPFAAAEAETRTETDLLAFLDSDILFISEPSAFILPAGIDAACRPVDVAGIGITGQDDDESEFWRRLYLAAGVDGPDWVETTVDQVRIHAYYQGGMSVVRRSASLFATWLELFERAMLDKIFPSIGPGYIDQATFSVVLSGREHPPLILPPEYNYPLHLHDRLKPESRIERVGDAVAIHYHRELAGRSGPRMRSSIDGLLSGDELSNRLEQLIENAGIRPKGKHRRLVRNLVGFLKRLLKAE